jgi:hypothetical protein
MARKAKRPAKKKASAKKPAKKKVGAKKLARKQSSTVKAVKKTARAVVKSTSQKTAAAAKSGKGFVRRAVEAIAQAAAPLLPGSAAEKPSVEEKPKGD